MIIGTKAKPAAEHLVGSKVVPLRFFIPLKDLGGGLNHLLEPIRPEPRCDCEVQCLAAAAGPPRDPYVGRASATARVSRGRVVGGRWRQKSSLLFFRPYACLESLGVHQVAEPIVPNRAIATARAHQTMVRKDVQHLAATRAERFLPEDGHTQSSL